MKPQWVGGNGLVLLKNGERFFARAFAAIDSARREILIETFIWFEDEVGRALRDALIRASQRGVQVFVLLDGWGTPDMTPRFVRPLLDAGVQVRVFEPAKRLLGTRINMLGRMHHKITVIDGMKAFVGGINFSADHLASSGPMSKQDYAVEVQGPLAGHIRAFCCANVDSLLPTRPAWENASCTGLVGGVDAADAPSPGAVAAFVTRDNADHPTDIEWQYRLAIRRASKHVVIANAYFFPGYRFLRDLRNASKRGVRVDLILQGQPDIPWVRTAAMLLYELMQRSGVHIHEFIERPLHAKVGVVDDEWATVGSSNLDPTSLWLNQEANVMVRDREFAQQLRFELESLIRLKCRTVHWPKPRWLRSLWISVKCTVVYHLLRRFPNWARKPRSREPRIVTLRVDLR